MSYSTPQGESRWPGVELKDHTYDGLHSQGQLYGGTGQLNDGTYGTDSFRQDLGHGRGEFLLCGGYTWVKIGQK